jgi:SOS-response transcriptional repressor LexA
MCQVPFLKIRIFFAIFLRFLLGALSVDIEGETYWTIKEMAEKLDIAPNTIQQRLSRRGLKPLKTIITRTVIYAPSTLEQISDFGAKGFQKGNTLAAKSKPATEEYPETTSSAFFVSDSSPDQADDEAVYGLVFLDSIAAGIPVRRNPDEWERIVLVPRRFVKTKPEDYFVTQVCGNSMIDALIPDGSIILLRWSDVPKHRKIQAVWIDEGVTLKRIIEGEDHTWSLFYEDGSTRTIPLGEENRIIGDFIAVLPPHTKPRAR